MKPIVHTVHADLELQANDRFHAVPFDVPNGTNSLGVRIEFDSTQGVVDLGCEGADGWRGWSGGARREFTIRPDGATPGYLPGPLETGRWSVILGLHNLPAGKVDIRVEITMPSAVELPAVSPPPTPVDSWRGSSMNWPAPAGYKWYAGDFHNHTLHSDGRHSIEELAALGVEMGLDFLAVTDHNTVSHHPHLQSIGNTYGITLIPGQEVTTHRGHANAFGDIGWIDFRTHPNEWVTETELRGGILSINHPIDHDCSWVEPLESKPGAVEMWHSSWYRDLYGDGIFAWMANWDRKVTLIGGNDFHTKTDSQRPGTPTTWVMATDNSSEAIIEGLKHGNTAITGSVRVKNGIITPRLQDCPILLRQSEHEILALNATGLVFVDFLGNRQLVNEKNALLSAPIEKGPYSLLMPDRKIVALSS